IGVLLRAGTARLAGLLALGTLVLAGVCRPAGNQRTVSDPLGLDRHGLGPLGLDRHGLDLLLPGLLTGIGCFAAAAFAVTVAAELGQAILRRPEPRQPGRSARSPVRAGTRVAAGPAGSNWLLLTRDPYGLRYRRLRTAVGRPYAIAVLLLAISTEELLYRGLLLGQDPRSVSWCCAVTVGSVAVAAWLDRNQPGRPLVRLIALGVLGTVNTVLVARTGSVLPAIAAQLSFVLLSGS
ncbi:MAG: CPBP family intramembrane metalloprotease, partial [Actinomycetota bacterium]|nr:CPBP family intramembrane metalloprotease [Actinomycetota bacterium]